ncbi:MAG: hypothetical protein HY513_05180 [Candidatus Aenigmarchaeota archaeon]|nr:hypothetical protein [Candidatus Aenigmarchaeota archaeon]
MNGFLSGVLVTGLFAAGCPDAEWSPDEDIVAMAELVKSAPVESFFPGASCYRLHFEANGYNGSVAYADITPPGYGSEDILYVDARGDGCFPPLSAMRLHAQDQGLNGFDDGLDRNSLQFGFVQHAGSRPLWNYQNPPEFDSTYRNALHAIAPWL